MNNIFGKFASGRWIFTVICALAYIYCVVTKVLPPADIKEIIMIVIVFYFQRPDRTNGKPDKPS